MVKTIKVVNIFFNSFTYLSMKKKEANEVFLVVKCECEMKVHNWLTSNYRIFKSMVISDVTL